MIKVKQIMTREVRTCRADDTLDVPARVMWENDVGVCPVVDEDKKVIGVITDRDICMSVFTKDAKLADLRVRDAMAKKVFSVQGGEPIAAAENLMKQFQVRRLPVTDAQGHLVGILSQNDLLREAVREHGKHQRDVTIDEVATLLNKIGEPRTIARA